MEILGLIDVPLWVLIPLIFVITAYLYGTWNFGAFDGYGLPGPKPYPFVGTIGPSFSKGFLEYDREIVKKYGKLIAMFNGRTPTIYVSDMDMIKTICVKESHNFTDRFVIHNGKEVASLMLSTSKGEQWRRLRNLSSPAFSTGKLKWMNFQVNRCSKVFTENMGAYAENGQPCDIKSVIQGFTMDTIAATGFSLELNSQKDPDNPFVKMGRKAIDRTVFNPSILIAFFLPFLLPIRALLNISFFPEDILQFFSDVTAKVVEHRKQTDSKESDIIQMLMNAHEETETENDVTDPAINIGTSNTKPEHKRMSREELVAQAIMFFLVGFETTATGLTYLCYNMAVYPEVQEKLYEEIKEHVGDKETLDYGLLSAMTYLDQCVNESLRLYTPGWRTDRICTKDVTVKGIHIKKGWAIFFPLYAMNHDPELWEDPDEFKPERFEDMSTIGNKFIPFGLGPRNCIGMRLALLELKTAIVHLLRDYKLVKIAETIFPMKLDPKKFVSPTEPIRIGVEKRLK